MFHCKSLLQLIDWNAKNKSKDGFMQIPPNLKAMKCIEEKWPRKFKDEPRSIRFGLEIDVVVLKFSFLRSSYSVWLVGLIDTIFPHG